MPRPARTSSGFRPGADPADRGRRHRCGGRDGRDRFTRERNRGVRRPRGGSGSKSWCRRSCDCVATHARSWRTRYRPTSAPNSMRTSCFPAPTQRWRRRGSAIGSRREHRPPTTRAAAHVDAASSPSPTSRPVPPPSRSCSSTDSRTTSTATSTCAAADGRRLPRARPFPPRARIDGVPRCAPSAPGSRPRSEPTCSRSSTPSRPAPILAGIRLGRPRRLRRRRAVARACGGLVSVNGYLIQDIRQPASRSARARSRILVLLVLRDRARPRRPHRATPGDRRRHLAPQLPRLGIDAADLDRAAAAFDNPDYVDVVIHSYRHRLGLAAAHPRRRRRGAPRRAAADHRADDHARRHRRRQFPATDGSQHDLFTGPREHRQIPDAGHHLPPRPRMRSPPR